MLDSGEIRIPNKWEPRVYQRPLFNSFGHGKQFQRGSVIWHRRAGKDSTVLNMTARDMFKRPGSYWHLFPEQSQARKAIWRGMDKQGRSIIDQFLPPEVRTRKKEDEMLIEVAGGSTWQLAGSDTYDSLVGSNPVGVVFTEWALSNPAAWDYIRPILLENGGWALFITTPRGRNHAYETHMMAQGNENWFDQILTIEDTGVLTEADMDAERAEGMSESKILQEYYCSFEAEVDEQFMPSTEVQAATDAEFVVGPEDPLIMGVDVARFGDDFSQIYFRRGRDARTYPRIQYAKIDTMELASRVAEQITREKPDQVFIDETGIGAGVVDRLHQLNFDVTGVNFGRKSDYRVDGAPKSVNKRTEMWATMREAFKSGMMIPKEPRLTFELLAPTYSFNGKMEIQLEKKEDMKKRGVRSPDMADALALTYAYPVQPKTMRELLDEQQAEEGSFEPFWNS